MKEVSKEDLKYVLKKHEERETPAQEAAESKKEQELERAAGVEKHAFWNGFEKQAKRAMLSDITSKMEPTMVVTFNPQDQRSKLFIQRLDKVLQDMGGSLDRVRIIALNQMMDQETIRQVGASTKEPSLILYRQGKAVGQLGGGASPTDMIEFMNSHRKHLV